MNVDTTIKTITNIIRFTLLISLALSIFESRWLVLFISIVTLLLTFLPRWIETKFDLVIPLEFQLIIVFFIFASLFLGEVGNFYERIWWWDIILHGMSAIAFGCIGFIILFILYEENIINVKPFWIAIFSLSFALAIGALWEIFEFAMDSIFNLNMQKSGLIDTMWDLIVDAIGGIIASIAGYFYLKTGKRSIISNLIEKILIKNKIRLYRKRNRQRIKNL